MMRPNITENPENNPPKAFTLNTNRGKNKTSASTAFNTTNTISKINESMTNAIARRVHRFWSALLARTTSNLRCIVSLTVTRASLKAFLSTLHLVICPVSTTLYIASLKRERNVRAKFAAFTAVAFAQ
jgi:hypothetical protein